MHHDPIDLPDNWAGEYTPDGLTEMDVDALLEQAGIRLDDLEDDPDPCWRPPDEPDEMEDDDL